MTQETNPRQQRLKILDLNEIDVIYGLPLFSEEDREHYFSLTIKERGIFDEQKTTNSKLSFILQLGYFKAQRLFFTFQEHEVVTDTQYIAIRYLPDILEPECAVSKRTRIKHQSLILELCGYRMGTENDLAGLVRKSRDAAMISGKPIYVFSQLLHFLEERKIVSPAYSSLQDLVGKALAEERERMSDILVAHLTPSDIQALNILLDDSEGLHLITQLKRAPRDFSATEIKLEVERGNKIRPLYGLAQRVLPSLEISSENIKYYASLVTYYSVYRLKRFKSWTTKIYLLCFIYHRYQQHHDNLLSGFIYYVRKFDNTAKVAAKNSVYEHRIDVNRNIAKAAQVIRLFTSNDIAKETPFVKVQNTAFKILKRKDLADVADRITAKLSFDEAAFKWDHVDKIGSQFKLYLRPILCSATIMTTPAHSQLTGGIDFLKSAFVKGKPLGQFPKNKVPVDFIAAHVARYLYRKNESGQKQLIPDRYEFYLYRLLRDRLEAGDIYCRDSVRYRSLEDDLIDNKTWHKTKDSLIERSGLSGLKVPVEDHLDDLEKELEHQFNIANDRIASGENKYFRIKEKRDDDKASWHLQYPADKDETNHTIFDSLEQTGIGSVLEFVDRQCSFVDAFEHVLEG